MRRRRWRAFHLTRWVKGSQPPTACKGCMLFDGVTHAAMARRLVETPAFEFTEGGDHSDWSEWRAGQFAAIKPAAPFLAVKNEPRRIDGFAAPMGGVVALAFGVTLGRERVFPADVIPIIDVESDKHEILPQFRI